MAPASSLTSAELAPAKIMEGSEDGMAAKVIMATEGKLAEVKAESAKTETEAVIIASEHKPKASFQAFLAAAVACLVPLAFGWSGGKIASTAEFVIAELELSDSMWYLVVSIQAIGSITGGLLGGPIGLRVGPYWTQYACDFFMILSALLMSLAPTGWVMLVGRLCNGIALGLAGSSVPPYLFEIAPRHLSGIFGCLFQLTITFGFFVAYFFSMDFLLGTPALWRWVWAMPGFICALHAVLFFFCPGPVMYQLQKGDSEKAYKALKRLRQGDCSAEFESMDDEVAQSQSQKVSVIAATRELLTNPRLRYPLVLCILIPIFVQFSGVGAITSYAVGLFDKAGMSDPKLGMTIVGLVHFVSTIPALDLVDRLGRTMLFGGGLAVMAVSYVLFTLGMALDWGFVTIVFMFVAVFGFSVGPGPVAWMYASEIVPTSVRPAAQALLSLMIGVAVFIVLMVSEPMFNNLGNYAVLPYAVLCTVFAVCVFMFMPETKGKSYAEVEAMICAHPISRLLAGKDAATRIAQESSTSVSASINEC